MNAIEIGIGIFIASLAIGMGALTIFLIRVCWKLWEDIDR